MDVGSLTTEGGFGQGGAQPGPRLPDLLFDALNSGLKDLTTAPKKLGSLPLQGRVHPLCGHCVTTVSAVPSLRCGFLLHHRAAAGANEKRLKVLSPASDECSTRSHRLACQQPRYRQKTSGVSPPLWQDGTRG